MEHERSERQTPIQFKCKKILPGMEKSENPDPVTAEITEIAEKEDPECILESPTPQKPESRSKTKIIAYAMKGKHLEDLRRSAIAQSELAGLEKTCHGDSSVSEFPKLCPLAPSRSLSDGQIELPDKYKTLANLFNRMESSIRLLALRKKMPTFQNICTQVEILTRRKFLYCHLAKMKHVFPEAILIEKILIHDEKSLCMKPDMKVTLVLDAVECPLDPDQSAALALCQVFHAKLLELFSTNPEGAEIPEALLPEPFNNTNHAVLHNGSLEGPPAEVPSEASLDSPPLSSASHLSPSFRRRFSQKAIVPETQLTQLLASPASLLPARADNGGKVFSNPPRKENLGSISSAKVSDEVIHAPGCGSQLPECTPTKHDSSADEVMPETPALYSPQRPIPTPQEKLVIEDGKSVMESKLTPFSVRRSLIYSSSETDGSVSDPVVCPVEQKSATKNRSVMGEDPVMHQESLACLPNMFDTISVISQSLGYSFITKQELVHKIISNSLEIEETREVEEQLRLLEELAPDWICKKEESSGGFLYSFKRSSDLESIRARIVEAV